MTVSFTSVKPVNTTGVKKSNKPAIAATVVGTAAVASAVAAFALGKGKDVDSKGFKAIISAVKEGYKVMGKGIADAAGTVLKFVKDGALKVKDFFVGLFSRRSADAANEATAAISQIA